MPNGLKATSIFSEAKTSENIEVLNQAMAKRCSLQRKDPTACLTSLWWLPVLRGYGYIPSLHLCLTSLAQVFSYVSYRILVIGSLANKDDAEYWPEIPLSVCFLLSVT